MKFTRTKTRRQREHSGSRSRTHREDQAAGEVRRQFRTFSVPASPSPSPKRDFGDLEGFELIRCEGGTWRRCEDPEEFGAFLNAEARARTSYKAVVSRHGHPESITRHDPTPIHIHTVVWHPAVSDWVAAEIKAGGDPKPAMREMLRRYIPSILKQFKGCRHVLGLAVHITDDPHLDICVSRQGPNGRIGRAGLHHAGPWLVGVDRQLRAGATVNPRKRHQYDRAMANFGRRYGIDAVPFDFALTRAFDHVAGTVLGDQLQPFMTAFADRVPAIERAHARAALLELERAREVILEDIRQSTGEITPPTRPITAAPLLPYEPIISY